MPRYKRTYDEAELDIPLEPEVPPQHVETLTQLRNMWEFASFMQYIFLFGHVVKIDDDFDIEDLEAECLRPEASERLAQIGLALLKYVSSHRGLTPEIFDEYARRQYVAKAPTRNPFGEDEEPAKFNEFDVFTKIRVLQQLSTWTLGNADRIRSLMPADEDQLNWRMEPLGWDKDDRAYFVLDDNRLYRRTDEPPPPPTPKIKAKKKAPAKKNKSRGARASKRRRIEDTSDDEAEDVDVEAGAEDDTPMVNGDHPEPEEEPGFGFTSKTWECLAITLDEYNDFLATIFRTRDPNEKQLRKRIEEEVLPIIEKRAEALRQKQLKKIRELENLEKMATAKRSSRLAGKAEREKEEREKREVEEKKQAELRMAHEEQERQRRIEEGHESRRLTREQRLKEREVKRILHEEELAKLEEQANRASSQEAASDAATDGAKRISERQLKTHRAEHKKELEKLAEDEDKWYFDCVVCGIYGENIDDGSHSIACERCNVWQHSECHGFSPKQAEKDGFHFICSRCKRKEEDAKKPKIAPLKLSKNRQSASPESKRGASRTPATNGPRGALPEHVQRQLDGIYIQQPAHQQMPSPYGSIANGPSLSPYGQAQGPAGYRYPPVGNFAPHAQHVPPPQQPWHGSPLPPPPRPSSSGYAGSPPPNMANGYTPPQQQHQQQHQSMHQNAVTASGGHPAYQAPAYQQPQMDGYSPRAPTGMYPATQPPPNPQYYQPHHPYFPPHHQQQPQQRTGSQGQLMNGFQSPVKGDAKPSSSSPPSTQHHQPYPQPAHGQARLQPSPIQPRPSISPQGPAAYQQQQKISHGQTAAFPPPPHAYQQNAQSPVKHSPSPSQYQQPPPNYQQRPPPPTTYTPTPPQAFRPPSSNGFPPPQHNTPQTTQTPQQRTHPSPAGSNANTVAADGMSGPWPEGSKTIPQKHDRSPAPPPPPPAMVSQATQTPPSSQTSAAPLTSSQSAGEAKIAPTVAPPVALSPSQQMQEQAAAAGAGSIPVKKLPAEDASGAESRVAQSGIDGKMMTSGVPTDQSTPGTNSERRPDINGMLASSGDQHDQ